MVSEKGHLEWKKMYFKLSRCYPHREQYSDTLHLCTLCHILFWKVQLPLRPPHFNSEQMKRSDWTSNSGFAFVLRIPTIHARPTTLKATPPPSPLRTLSVCLISDPLQQTLPFSFRTPLKYGLDCKYCSLYIQMFLFHISFMSWMYIFTYGMDLEGTQAVGQFCNLI